MGQTASAPSSDGDLDLEYQAGYRVINLHKGSPCAQANVDVFFDFIVKANEVLLDEEDESFMAIIKDSLAKSLRLTLYSTKTSSSRDVIITPSRDWGGPGTLGATIRYDQIKLPDEHAWHVLDVHPKSPAAISGLQPHTDYLLSTVELIFKDEDDLDYVSCHPCAAILGPCPKRSSAGLPLITPPLRCANHAAGDRPVPEHRGLVLRLQLEL